MNSYNVNPDYILYGVLSIAFLILLYTIFIIFFENDKICKNIHYYSFYDKIDKRIMYHKSNPFYRNLKDVYMSDTIKKEITSTIGDFIKHSKNFKKQNVPRSLRFILSGVEGIGKTTLIEAISSEFDYGLIHFPKNNYTEKMVHSFFKDVNTFLGKNNIIMFDGIDFDAIQNYNKQLYELLAELVIKNDNNNIFMFTFNSINSIPVTFSSNFHIHHHYHMDVNINYVMNMISNNMNQWSENDISSEELIKIKNNLLNLNHKITPGYIIPYLIFNENFQKSLERFFKVIKN